MTSCIPLLLRSLTAFKDEEFDEAEFLASNSLQLVNENIVQFYNKLLDNIGSEERRQR